MIARVAKTFTKFKFQYDNTLRFFKQFFTFIKEEFKFQYDNTLSPFVLSYLLCDHHLNSNMIIL